MRSASAQRPAARSVSPSARSWEAVEPGCAATRRARPRSTRTRPIHPARFVALMYAEILCLDFAGLFLRGFARRHMDLKLADEGRVTVVSLKGDLTIGESEATFKKT